VGVGQKTEDRGQRSDVRLTQIKGKREDRDQKSEVGDHPGEIEKKKAFHGVKRTPRLNTLKGPQLNRLRLSLACPS